MKLRSLALLASATLLTLCSCSTSRWSQPVTDPAAQYTLEGVTVRPPQGSNWFLVAEGSGSVVFARRFTDEAVSTIASASTGSADAAFGAPAGFLRHVESVLSKGRDPERATAATCSARLTRRFGDYCVEYIETFLDEDSPGAAGRTMRVENRGCWVLHPEDTGRSVVLLYSTRRPSSEPMGGGAAAERFFSSVQLTPDA